MAQRNLIQAVTRISRVDQVGVEHDVMLCSSDIAADPAQRRLVIVKDLGDILIGDNCFDLFCKLSSAKRKSVGDARLGGESNLYLGGLFLCNLKGIGRWLTESFEQGLFLLLLLLGLGWLFNRRCPSDVGIKGNRQAALLRLL